MNKTEKIYRKANEYFSRCLENNDKALRYLHDRRISLSAARHFQLGYAESGFKGLLENLEQDFEFYDVMSSGLFMVKEDEIRAYFQDRIIFPVIVNGKIVSFTSRALSNDVNTRHKHLSKTVCWLYNEAALEFPIVVVVESPIDAITFYQAGYPAVATMGTNVRLSDRMLNQSLVYTAFDNDLDKKINPGLDFAIRFGYNIKQSGKAEVRVVQFPTQKGSKMDANSYFLQSTTPIDDFRRLIAEAQDITSFPKYWRIVMDEKKRVKKREKHNRGSVTLDEIKQIPLAEVIDTYVENTIVSDKLIMCKCPFHDDTSPSMTIYKESNTFMCRGASCGKHGDVIQFVQYADEVSFSEACKRLKEGSYGAGSRYARESVWVQSEGD